MVIIDERKLLGTTSDCGFKGEVVNDSYGFRVVLDSDTQASVENLIL